MLFNKGKNHPYGHIENNFIYESPTISLSTISTLISEEEIAPYGCAGIAESKILAIKKGASESLDRRSSMFYKIKKIKFSYIYSYNLIKEAKKIDRDKCHFRSEKPVIDTTGTAAHSISQKALEKSICELLQKNSLFLFWYGATAKNYKKEGNGHSKFYFVEDTFFPCLTIVCVHIIENKYISMGLGTNVDFNKALKASEEECYLIQKLVEHSSRKLKNGEKLSESEQDQHQFFLNEFSREYLFKLKENALEYKANYKEYSFHEAIDMLPAWLVDLRVYIIPQRMIENIICVKSFSNQLYTSVPKKDFLDLNKAINVKNINLSETDLKEKPDLPLI